MKCLATLELFDIRKEPFWPTVNHSSRSSRIPSHVELIVTNMDSLTHASLPITLNLEQT